MILRREFITLVGSAVATWPIAAQAQQTAMPVIGFLHSASHGTSVSFVAGLKRGLTEEVGFVEGRDVAIEYRWAQNQYESLPALAAELVRRPVSVIVAGGGPPSALAVKAATSTIPVVFLSGTDPVKLGIVESLNRPGGNLTGVVFFNSALTAKRLELLRELAPSATVIGFLTNPDNPETEPELKDAREAARASLYRESGRRSAARDNDRKPGGGRARPLAPVATCIDPAPSGTQWPRPDLPQNRTSSVRPRLRPATNKTEVPCDALWRNPITGIATGCCARAASGHTAAAPPSSVIN